MSGIFALEVAVGHAVAARLNDDVGPCCCSGLSIMYEGAFSLVRPLWFVGNINFLLDPQKLQGRVCLIKLLLIITQPNLQVHPPLPNSKTSKGMLFRFGIDFFTFVILDSAVTRDTRECLSISILCFKVGPQS